MFTYAQHVFSAPVALLCLFLISPLLLCPLSLSLSEFLFAHCLTIAARVNGACWHMTAQYRHHRLTQRAGPMIAFAYSDFLPSFASAVNSIERGSDQRFGSLVQASHVHWEGDFVALGVAVLIPELIL